MTTAAQSRAVGFLTRWLKGDEALPVPTSVTELARNFSTSIDSGVLYGTPTIDDYIRGRHRVTRRDAIAVPAVKRARDLIAGGIGQFPLQLFDRQGTLVDWQLFNQFEADVPRSVSLTRLVEDLLFYGTAWWKVTHLGWHGKPAEVQRLDPATVTVHRDYITHSEGTAEAWIPHDQLIRFDGPNEGLLVAGAAAINVYRGLANATANAAEALPPMTYFAPVDDVDPLDDDEVKELLADWKRAREQHGTAYVPAALKLNALGWSPEQLELTELRDQAVLEIARLCGVDPEELGVSTTSRTYANAADRHRQFLDFTLGPIMTAIEGRLEMSDVVPFRFDVEFDTANFLRADDLTRAQTDAALIAAGILTINEAREHRGLAPLDTPTPAKEDAPHGVR